MNMLMNTKNRNRTSLKYCHSDCMQGQGHGKGRKENRRHAKRSERQCWRSEVRNYS